jgi:hypothetical protein
MMKKIKTKIAKSKTANDRAHDEGMAELFAEDAGFAKQYLESVFAEGEPLDRYVALRHLRAAIAAGRASGSGQSANVVLKRVEARYRNLLD